MNDYRNLAPVGWHVPNDSDWQTLVTWLGGDMVAGGKQKESGTTHWRSPNAEATNESNFTALPAGARSFGGWFGSQLEEAYFWSSTQSGNWAWACSLHYLNGTVNRTTFPRPMGFSVRLVRDVVDSDYDGTSDNVDNCPSVSNSTQADANRDGIGDACCCLALTGNVDGNSGDIVDISDLSAMVDYLFFGGAISGCPNENDVDTSGAIDISDLTLLVDFLFFGASLPSCP